MAYDYNKFKQAYERLNDDQKNQFETNFANNSNYQQFKRDYANEQNNTQQSDTNDSNFNNGTGTTSQNSEKKVYNQQTGYYEPEKTQNNNQNYDTTKSYSSDLDTTKFNQAP